MKVTVIPIIIGALGMVPKSLVRGLQELEIEGHAETIQTTSLLRLVRILRRDLDTWKTCSLSNSNERPSAKITRSNNDNNPSINSSIFKSLIQYIFLKIYIFIYHHLNCYISQTFYVFLSHSKLVHIYLSWEKSQWCCG